MNEFCCVNCLQADASVECGHGCGAAYYCGQSCADAHYDVHEMECVGARAGRGGRGRSKKGAEQAKIHKVMDEFKHHHLHSGSKRGPIVTNRKQAIAIALSEARRNAKK